MDAVGSTMMRKRVLGIVKFLEDCIRGAAPRKKAGDVVEAIDVYDFDRLRHKLGIDERRTAPAPIPIAAPTQQAAPVPQADPGDGWHQPPGEFSTGGLTPPARRDFAAMSVADLAGLPRESLSAAELEDAMRAAIKLDARELAVAFAKAGVAKPADGAKPDRYPFYATLMTGAQSEGHTADALRYADEGAKYDGEYNAGKRANEYGLRKAALYTKTGNTDAAAAEFDAILDRHPDEGNFYVKAAEAMLGAKRGDKAAYFAEKGLAKARANGNRDLEGACRELADAARRYT
jgi:hypothetical protein